MFDTIYLSPHLDDAALSCAGRIYQQTAVGKKVLIVTIMAGDPDATVSSTYAQMLHERWQLAQGAVAARRAEDVIACQILGAEFKHFSIPDCIYRFDAVTGQELYPDWPQITGPIHPNEQTLVSDLAEQLANLPLHQKIVSPLAIGNHVDHQIVRQAAERCFGNQLIYYEDFPYSQKQTARTAVIPANTNDWQSELIPLSQAAFEVKVNAIAAFTSQLSTFFNGRADLEQQIFDHNRKFAGERYWQHKTSVREA